MDIRMPVMNGYEATRGHSQHEDRPDAATIPILAMTADAFEEDLRRAKDAGMNDCLIKPIDAKQGLCCACQRRFKIGRQKARPDALRCRRRRAGRRYAEAVRAASEKTAAQAEKTP
jgi:CheY-like chemotaxis protein